MMENLDNERENYLRNDDIRSTEEHYRRQSQRSSNSGGGCVIALLVLAGSLISASYGIYQFFC